MNFRLVRRFKADLVAEKARGRQCRIHLEVDTRGCKELIAVRPETALVLLERLRQQSTFVVAGVYSHLATADEPDDPFALEQIALFEGLRTKVAEEGIVWHLANSGGCTSYPTLILVMVRPGLLCYGLTPDGRDDSAIRPIISLQARISYFRSRGSGTWD